MTLAASATVSNVDFGNEPESTQEEWDFGDAPDSYSTTDSAGGPKHKIDDSGPFLGDDDSHKPDAESDGQPSADAKLDDTNSVSPHTKEEATPIWVLIRQEATVIGGTGTADLTLTGAVNLINGGPADGILDGWIDLNQNGTFEASEHVISGETLTSSPGTHTGARTFEFVWTESGVVGPIVITYDFVSRFRISRAGSSDPTGPAEDGEVEDHKVTFTIDIGNTVPEMDTTEVDVFEATEGTFTLLGPNMPAGGAQIGVSGPTTVHVLFEAPNEGDALDNQVLRPDNGSRALRRSQ